MTANVTVGQVKAEPIAVVRRRARQSELAKVVPDAGHWTDDASQLRTDIFYLLA